MTTAVLYKGEIQWRPADERGVRDTGQTTEDNKFTRRRPRPDRPDRLVEVTLERGRRIQSSASLAAWVVNL